ncbi:MAG: response regulator transcription factor [Vicinamibacterales bacterium]
MNAKSRVLVVDDEPSMAQDLDRVLTTDGYQVRTVAEGESALSSFDEFRPHLVFTERNLPTMDGIELCRRIRAFSSVPVVVVSCNGSESDKVNAFDSGADDYVTKPYGAGELLARTRALLRRSADALVEAPLEIGAFRIDFESRRVYIAGDEVRLTPKEFNLLVYMARHPGRVIEHARLLQAVWGEAAQDHPEYLRVFIGQLRKKLEPEAARPRYLLTEAWVGYRFNPNG